MRADVDNKAELKQRLLPHIWYHYDIKCKKNNFTPEQGAAALPSMSEGSSV
jgi:hypothetical protein